MEAGGGGKLLSQAPYSLVGFRACALGLRERRVGSRAWGLGLSVVAWRVDFLQRLHAMVLRLRQVVEAVCHTQQNLLSLVGAPRPPTEVARPRASRQSVKASWPRIQASASKDLSTIS